MERTDTIAAISTPHGTGGIAIIKISGPDARWILASCFRPAKKDFPYPPKDVSFGKVLSRDGTFVDEAVALYFDGREATQERMSPLFQREGREQTSEAVLAEAILSPWGEQGRTFFTLAWNRVNSTLEVDDANALTVNVSRLIRRNLKWTAEYTRDFERKEDRWLTGIVTAF